MTKKKKLPRDIWNTNLNPVTGFPSCTRIEVVYYQHYSLDAKTKEKIRNSNNY